MSKDGELNLKIDQLRNFLIFFIVRNNKFIAYFMYTLFNMKILKISNKFRRDRNKSCFLIYVVVYKYFLKISQYKLKNVKEKVQ